MLFRSGAMNTSSTISTVGGITFPTNTGGGTQATLNDFEEGSFTAYWAGTSGGSAAFTGSNNYGLYSSLPNGKYTKIGKRVAFNFYLSMANSFSYASGMGSSTNAWISGLPFAEGSGTGLWSSTYPACCCGYYSGLNGWSAGYTPMGIIESGTNSIRVSYATLNTVTQTTLTFFANGGNGMIWAGVYTTG